MSLVQNTTDTLSNVSEPLLPYNPITQNTNGGLVKLLIILSPVWFLALFLIFQEMDIILGMWIHRKRTIQKEISCNNCGNQTIIHFNIPCEECDNID